MVVLLLSLFWLLLMLFLTLPPTQLTPALVNLSFFSSVIICVCLYLFFFLSFFSIPPFSPFLRLPFVCLFFVLCCGSSKTLLTEEDECLSLPLLLFILTLAFRIVVVSFRIGDDRREVMKFLSLTSFFSGGVSYEKRIRYIYIYIYSIFLWVYVCCGRTALFRWVCDRGKMLGSDGGGRRELRAFLRFAHSAISLFLALYIYI